MFGGDGGFDERVEGLGEHPRRRPVGAVLGENGDDAPEGVLDLPVGQPVVPAVDIDEDPEATLLGLG